VLGALAVSTGVVAPGEMGDKTQHWRPWRASSAAARRGTPISSNVVLPAGEPFFFIGGEYGVRGCPTGAHAGNQGWGRGRRGGGLRAARQGCVKVFRPPVSLLRDHEELAGIGLGLTATPGGRLSARATLADAPNALPPTEPRRCAVHVQVVAGLCQRPARPRTPRSAGG
jgi:hypothetical protein